MGYADEPPPRPLGAYLQAVAENRPPIQIVRAARACSTLPLDESVPALLATVLRIDDLFERSLERWVQRYRDEIDPTTSDAELDLLRGALATIEKKDATSRIGAEAFEGLLALHGFEYGRWAVARWSKQLP